MDINMTQKILINYWDKYNDNLLLIELFNNTWQEWYNNAIILNGDKYGIMVIHDHHLHFIIFNNAKYPRFQAIKTR